MKKLLLSLLLLIATAFAQDLSKLDPLLRHELKKDGKQLSPLSTQPIRKVKVLRKDGKVEVVNLSKVPLKKLMEDNDIIYIEAPRKLKPLTDITFKSSYAVLGSGNQNIQVNYGSFFGYIYDGSVSGSGCSFNGNYFYCNQATTLNVSSSSGNFKLLLAGDNLSKNHIIGGNEKYLVGTKASLSQKTGNGVIVGVVDSGINFCHPAFRKEDGTTRVLFFKSYNGTELNRSQINQKINQGDCNYDDDGHGTAVASVAGGYWANSRFNSQAKDVEFIIYQTDLSTIDVIEGINYIKQRSQALGKTTVVNLSLGGHFGPHDGKSLSDRAMDQMASSGFIIVAAAGNEGNKRIHAKISSSSAQVDINIDDVDFLIDGWFNSDSSYRIGVCSGSSCLWANPGDDRQGNIGNGFCNVRIINDNQPRLFNNDKEVIIIGDCSYNSLTLKVERVSGSSSIDFWISSQNGEFTNYYQSDGFGGFKYTVGSPATANRVIAVGAIGGNPANSISFRNFGRIAFFSSRGPTRDGRLKPEIVANGYFVCVAKHSFNSSFSNTCSNYYEYLPGTSFAAPVVTALVAMYLQGNPNATPEEVKNWLIQNAVYDVEGSKPNNVYGYGKAVWPFDDSGGSGDSGSSGGSGGGSGGSGGSESGSSGGGGGGCSMGYGTSPINTLIWLLLPAFILVRRFTR